MTPYQTRISIKGLHDRMLILSWHIAALSRQKKLPDLKTLINTREKKSNVLDLKAELQRFGGKK